MNLVKAALSPAQEDFLFPPLPELADCLRPGMVKTLPGGDYFLPAGMHPLFLVILGGEILVHGGAGPRPMARMCLCGGTRAALMAWAAPGTRILTLAVRPGQLRRLVGFPGSAIMDGWAAFEDFLSGQERGEAARCEAAIAETDDPARQAEAFLGFLAGLRRNRLGVAADLSLPPDLLSLPAPEIATRFGLGLRQFERRFLASYGQSLRSLRQQWRCSQLLASMVGSPPQIASWADQAARFGYFDQAHLNHDLVRFTGHTPGQLAAGLAGDAPAFWPYRISPLQLVRLFGSAGY